MIIIRNLGLTNWKNVFYEMNKFTKKRNFFSKDEIWFVEHFPIFTVGQKLNIKKINIKTNIPYEHTNRGGEITYHGPGQQIIYLLINIKNKKIKPSFFITLIENIVIKTFNFFSIKSYKKKFFPGIYINKKKVCSIGLRIINGCTLHGLSINVDMNLSPFNLIFPCGDKFIKMTQLKDYSSNISFVKLKNIFLYYFTKFFNIKKIKYKGIRKMNLF
ncbi:lipoyl(octanoyl) transferase LipB [Buchnera aphidicola]|uniref:lipoyl(octanoyl) transferase LipB n=1 Tax=Buchnera aphidicola TaxID=9 RepID=UPI0031B892D2